MLEQTTGNKGPKCQNGNMKEIIIMTASAFGFGPMVCFGQQDVSREAALKSPDMQEGQVLTSLASSATMRRECPI